MTVFSLIALLALYVFFDVLQESGDLGKDGYGVGSMLAYVALLIPAHTYELLPLAVLLWCAWCWVWALRALRPC